jgi:hypothetical protein
VRHFGHHSRTRLFNRRGERPVIDAVRVEADQNRVVNLFLRLPLLLLLPAKFETRAPEGVCAKRTDTTSSSG